MFVYSATPLLGDLIAISQSTNLSYGTNNNKQLYFYPPNLPTGCTVWNSNGMELGRNGMVGISHTVFIRVGDSWNSEVWTLRGTSIYTSLFLGSCGVLLNKCSERTREQSSVSKQEDWQQQPMIVAIQSDPHGLKKILG